MIKDYFSLSAWHPFGDSQLWLIRADVDWCSPAYAEEIFAGPWLSVTLGLFGFCVCATYWPRGKK